MILRAAKAFNILGVFLAMAAVILWVLSVPWEGYVAALALAFVLFGTVLALVGFALGAVLDRAIGAKGKRAQP